MAKKSLGQLIDKPFKDLNSSLFETGFDADLSSPQINAFSGIDEDTGLLMLKDTKKDLKDGISNIILTGALAQQKLQLLQAVVPEAVQLLHPVRLLVPL
ncbi:MAG: hypothetical protein L6V95_07805 [Candidatus Melainabacteria bacterium]|nr:MAG: hypothetical protein L6V95_07805 [Candidatus Melainabacteria bacterium]